MIKMTCAVCRLVWKEKRSEGDSPVHHMAFVCPRCGTVCPEPEKVAE